MPEQDVVVEMYYGGTWHDVTSDVLTRNAISITRGRSEGAQSTSSLATLTMRGHEYNPRNVGSALFGKIGRNTPARVGVRHHATTGTMADIADAFGRTSSSGWGNPDVGGAWSLLGAGGTVLGTDWTVASGVGNMFVPIASAYRLAWIPTAYIADGRFELTFDTAISDVLGGSIEPGNIIIRGASSLSEYVLFRTTVAADETVTISIHEHTASGDTLLASAQVTRFTWSGQPIRVQAEARGQYLQMRAYDPAGTVPADDVWDASTTSATVVTPGGVGVRNGVAAGNTNTKPVEFRTDDLSVTAQSTRILGEVASWKPKSEVYGDQRVEIEIAGALRRIQQGDDPLRSSAYRAVAGPLGATMFPSVSQAPIAYWPLEDGETAFSAHSDVPGVPDLIGRSTSSYNDPVTGRPLPPPGLPKFGAGTGPAGSSAIASLAEGGTLFSNIPSGPSVTGWELHFTARFTAGVFPTSPPITNSFMQWSTEGAVRLWSVAISEDGVIVVFNAAPAVYTASVALDDGAPHHIAIWTADAGGGNTTLGIVVDDVPVGGGSITGATGRPTSVEINQLEVVDETFPIAFGHLAFYAPLLSAADASAVVSAHHGHVGETAGARIRRLWMERGGFFVADGDLSTTELVGPQRTLSTLDLISESERTDGGLLCELPHCSGILYRTRIALYNQASVLDVDFALEHIAPPVEPVVDDLDVFNDVTATAPDNTSVRVSKDTGPLNVQAPDVDPEGVGRCITSVAVNPADVSRLSDLAYWFMGKNTIDETRYPRITVDLGSAPALAALASIATPGDVISVANLEPDQVELMVGQTIEVIGTHTRTIAYGASPASAYRVGVWGSSKWAGMHSSLNAQYVSGTDTTISVATEAGYTLWGGGAGFDAAVSGVRVQVDAIGQVLNTNAFMQGSVTGWTAQNGSIAHSTAQQYRSAWGSCLITPNGSSASGGVLASASVVVSASTEYVVQCWVYSPGGHSDLRACVDWYTAGGVFISSGLGSGTAVTAGKWKYLAQTLTSPGTAGLAVVRARHGGTPSAGDVWYTTAVAIAPASTASTSPQTFTIAQTPLNGVIKTVPAGALSTVRLANPAKYGL